MGTGCTNVPFDWCSVLHLSSQQIATNGQQFAVRMFQSGIWQDWQPLVTNSDLPIFQSFIVDPQGSDRIVLTLTNNADSGKVFATNGDVTVFNGYIKGVQIEHNTNKLTVFLSENRAGNIRINVMYMKL